jgi:hypothetical protein
VIHRVADEGGLAAAEMPSGDFTNMAFDASRPAELYGKVSMQALAVVGANACA